MTPLQRFGREADLAAQSELERVRRLTYFLGATASQSEVPLAGLLKALEELHLSLPNTSRLRARMTPANGFVRATSPGSVKLHFKKLREYEEAFPRLRQGSDGLKYKAAGLEGRYVATSRIAELGAIQNARFDLRKLIALLNELNVCAAADCFFATAMLLRAVLDHVPPLFGCNSFNEVANNAAGTRSFKESMRHLNEGARKIADAHLHVPIRSQETLPNERQVDFSQSLDVLLAEVVRLLRSSS